MTGDSLDAMWARWNHILASLFPWLREEVQPMTEQLGRLITILDVIGLGSFVPEPPRGPERARRRRTAVDRTAGTGGEAYFARSQWNDGNGGELGSFPRRPW